MLVRRLVVRAVVFIAVFAAVVLLIEAVGVAFGGGSFEAGLSLKRALIGAAITVVLFEVFQRLMPRQSPTAPAQDA